MDWYVVESSIRDDWRDAPSNDYVLQQLLDGAKQQILAFDNGYNWRLDPGNAGIDFPGDYPDGSVPSSLVMGQRMQARNLWNSSRVDPQNGTDGDDQFAIRPFPLDWVVKQVIRPKRVLGFVG